MDKEKVCKEKFARRFKKLIEENSETIYTIAEVVQLTPATISRYTTANMAPKITTIEVLAKYFDVSSMWLMGYDVPAHFRHEETEVPTSGKGSIARILRKKRNQAGLSIKDVIEKLKCRGIQISDKTIYGWESGRRQPSSYILIELCDVYGMKSFDELLGSNNRQALTPDEQKIIDGYRKLSNAGKTILTEVTSSLIDYEENLVEIKKGGPTGEVQEVQKGD